MSGLVAPPKQAAAFLLALAASLAIALLVPTAVVAGIPEELSGEYSSECVKGGNIIDPVGVLFRGSQASAGKSAFEVKRAAGWRFEGEGAQKLKVKVAKGEYECRNVNVQPASEPEYRIDYSKLPVSPIDILRGDPFDFVDVPDERFHVRLWFVPSSQNAEERKTVGTPHHEDFVKYNHGIGNDCKGAVKVEVKGHVIYAKGGHAIDKGGTGTELDSGFDQGRQELRRSLENTAHNVTSEKWGNDTVVEQCDEDPAGSNGNGIVIGMNWVKAGYTEPPLARQSSARLLGRLETTEKSTEWWFEYGPSSSEGAGTYPHKTPVKSVAEAEEVDVERPVSGLSPGSTYYVRMFVRDGEGGIEEGNEVKFETCGVETADEDDRTVGPRAATPECSGVVDAFYRDVNGDLGHQAWSPEGDLSTETLPASIAHSAVPRVVPRSDGTSIVDVFYREADDDLGHRWWTPGSGWQVEERNVSMASDPNVVTRPDGTIDAFYRTAGGELGHEWWVPGSGWSSEVRPTALSSDPHAVAHEDGSIDVLYRAGSGLGRDNWTSENGWTHEVRSGSLVAEPRPLVGESGALDVFYRTAENKLGHDWFIPGTGWSRETRSASLASDPHVVRRPNGTIDVFYRTAGDELGHDWWISGSGWSTETRPGNLSSDPHVVARSDGTVEVFYRDGKRIGHQWFVPGEGWSVELRPGPIAWHTDPHVVTQSDGRIDVVYETPTGQLGRDWYVPGGGWRHEIRPTTRPRRPVASYSFDAGAGEVLEDVSGENDGGIEGAEWSDTGKFGSALYFDGSEGDLVTVPDSNDLDLTDEFTLEAWVRPDEANEWSAVITKERGGALSYQMHAEGEAEAPAGYVENSEGHFEVEAGDDRIPSHVWSHLAMTYDGSNLRYYINGEFKGEDSSGDPGVSANPLFIGGDSWGEEDSFKGLIDEVRIYDRALDEGELVTDKGLPIQTPSRPPVAAYSFETGEGELAEDLAGNNDGTLEGAEWFDRGKFGSALLFNGEETCLTVPHDSDLELSEEMTVEAWVKPYGLSDQPVIYKSAWGNLGYALGVSFFNTAKPEGLIGEGVGKFEDVVSPQSVEENVWVHLALTYDGATMRLYVNGSLVASQAQSTPPPTGEGPLAIGCNPLYPEDFDGLIDEVRIYDRALDAGEIAADKTTPIQTPSRPPVAAYSFDAGEGTFIEDLFGHNGMVEGATWTDRGKYGKALTFNGGEGEKVTIPDSDDLDLTDELTLEAWVRPTEAVEWSAIVTKVRGSGISYQLTAHADHNAPVGYLANAEKEWGVDGGTTPLPAKTWSHIAFTSDGGRIRFYVNGKLKGSDSMLVAAEPSTGPLVIGGETFKGRIDEVRVYDRALSEGELATDKGAPIETPSRLPRAAYSFDAGGGEFAEDVAGENDGAIEGAEWFERGKFGSALYFDGTTDLVTVPDSTDLDLTDEFTLEAWVRPDEANEWSAVITKERGEGGLSYQMHAEGEGDAPVGYVENSEGQFEVEAGDDPIPPRVWSHLAMTYDGAKLRYYINGEFKGEDSSGEPGVSADPLLIGGNITWGEEDAFKGLIDEIRIYDRALSEAEVGTDMNTGLQSPSRTPVAAYPLDTGEGEVAEDAAGGHDGEIEGAEWFDHGRYGSALSFDGENDCVTVPDAEELRITEELTVEAWVKPRSLSDQTIVFKDSYGFKGHQLAIGLYETGKPEAFLGEGYEGEYDSIAGTESLEANIWTHLAFTYDGGRMRLYVNGDLADDKGHPEGAPWGEGDLAIGCNPLYPPEQFDGLIDEVRVYNRALTEAEVETDMSGS